MYGLVAAPAMVSGHNGSMGRRDPYLVDPAPVADTPITIFGCYAARPPHVPRWPAAPNTP